MISAESHMPPSYQFLKEASQTVFRAPYYAYQLTMDMSTFKQQAFGLQALSQIGLQIRVWK